MYDLTVEALHYAESLDRGKAVIGLGLSVGGTLLLESIDEGWHAAVCMYPDLPKNLDAVKEASVPILASFGGQDSSCRGAASSLDQALSKSTCVHDIKEYPHAGHSFLNCEPSGPKSLHPLLRLRHVGWNSEAAQDSWQRIDAFFEKLAHSSA